MEVPRNLFEKPPIATRFCVNNTSLSTPWKFFGDIMQVYDAMGLGYVIKKDEETEALQKRYRTRVKKVSTWGQLAQLSMSLVEENLTKAIISTDYEKMEEKVIYFDEQTNTDKRYRTFVKKGCRGKHLVQDDTSYNQKQLEKLAIIADNKMAEKKIIHYDQKKKLQKERRLAALRRDYSSTTNNWLAKLDD